MSPSRGHEAGRAPGDHRGGRRHPGRCSGPKASGSSASERHGPALAGAVARGAPARRAGELAQPLAAAAARHAQLGARRRSRRPRRSASARRRRARRSPTPPRTGPAGRRRSRRWRRRGSSRPAARSAAPTRKREYGRVGAASSPSARRRSSSPGPPRRAAGRRRSSAAIASGSIAERLAARPPAHARLAVGPPCAATPSSSTKRPEPVHVVEVDAHALPQQQPAALVDRRRACRAPRRAPRASAAASAHGDEPVAALARLGGVGALVGDQLGAAGVLLAQLQPRAGPRRREVGVALDEDARGRSAPSASAARQRPLRVGIGGLELDVARGGHAGER